MDKLESMDRKRRYAWNQFFRLWDIHKDVCNELIKASEIENQIENIPKHVKEWLVLLSKKAKEFFTCSICLEEIDNEKKTMITRCGHLFHIDCIDQVENNTCPECRCKMK